MRLRNISTGWNTYRTRFLIKAKQLTSPLTFVDSLGREHRGQPGDYLVESCDGSRSIAPRVIFEDVYVCMGPGAPVGEGEPVSLLPPPPPSALKRRLSARSGAA